jgi:hypothetical protein
MELEGSEIIGRPGNAAEALRALDTVSTVMQRAGDARAAFPDIYAIITRRVAEEVARPDCVFWEPAWISRLAGRFCEIYLETLEASLAGRQQACDAWELAYKYGAAGASVPAQDAFLGLSAHINYDLALGITATIEEFGHADDERMLTRYKHDHDQVNTLLHECVFVALERLVERHGCVLSGIVHGRARRTARWLTMQVLQRWRAHVWGVVLAMLRARRSGERELVVAAMGRRAATIARVLTLPSALYLAGRPLLPSAAA